MATNPYQSPSPQSWTGPFDGLLALLGIRSKHKPPFCTFCGRQWEKSDVFVEGAGPQRKGGIFICHNCVAKCAKMINEELIRRENGESAPAAKP